MWRERSLNALEGIYHALFVSGKFLCKVHLHKHLLLFVFLHCSQHFFKNWVGISRYRRLPHLTDLLSLTSEICHILYQKSTPAMSTT